MAKKSIYRRLYVSVCLLFVAFALLVSATLQFEQLNNGLLTLFTLIFVTVLAFLFKWQLSPLSKSLTALDDGIKSFNDNDFSLTIQNQHFVEVEKVINIYNELATVLRNERMDIFQRELLLDTVIQSTPVALILTNRAGSIVYSNASAKHLFDQSNKLNGTNFFSLLSSLSPELKKATENQYNGLVTEISDEQSMVYNVNCQRFMLNGREHNLYLYKNMTAEISRKETDMWKQVIRLISHELNNSLAPIASLTRSAKKIIEKPEHTHMLHDVLETIGNRTNHLHQFISQYAEFSRLPQPNIKAVDLKAFFNNIASFSEVKCELDIYRQQASFDAGQIEQVVINLIKNAKESGSAIEDVGFKLQQQANLLTFTIYDRGCGLTDTQMQQVLLPFFTTKSTGTGVGLALCNEIVNSHGGNLRLNNRDHGGLAVSFSLDLSQ